MHSFTPSALCRSAFSKSEGLRLTLAVLLLTMGGGVLPAASLTWDADGVFGNGNQDGGGTWSAANANWNDGAADVVWPNSGANDDAAVFGAGSGAAGTVNVSGLVNVNSLTFAAPGSGNYTLGGTTLTLNGATPTITTNVNATISAPVSGSAGLTKNGAAALTLSGNNSFTGGTTVSQGVLILNSATAAGGYNAGAISLGDASTANNNVELRFGGTITGTDVAVRGGVNARRQNPIIVANTGSSEAATLAFQSGVMIYSDLALSRSTTITSNGAGVNSRPYMGQITGTGAGIGNDTLIIDSGAGNWNLMYPKDTGVTSLANTYTGNLYVKSGNLQIGNLSYLGATAANMNLAIPDTASVTVNAGSTLMFVWGNEAFDGLNGGGNIANNTGGGGNKTLTIGAADGSGDFSGVIGPAFALVKTGDGTQILSGANTYNLTTTIDDGVLQIGNGGASGTLGAGAVTITSPGNLTFNRSDSYTVSNQIGGTGSLTQAGAGTLTLSNTGNTFSGGVTISGGVLSTTNAGNIPSASTVTITNGATWRIGNNGTIYNNGLAVAGGDSGIIQIAAGTLNEQVNGNVSAVAGNLTFDTSIAGNNGGVILSGAAMGAAAAGSVITFDKGSNGNYIANRLATTSAMAAFANSKVAFNRTGGGNLDLLLSLNSGSNAEFGALDGGDASTRIYYENAAHGGTTVTINGTTNGNFAGVLSNLSQGIGALVKNGTSTQTLSGDNTYTGTTAVNGGTLRVDGTHSGTGLFTVNSGGTLGGIGTIAAGVQVNSNGRLAPGASPGILNVASLNMTTGAFFDVEIGGPALGGYDRLAAMGAAALGGASLTVDLVGGYEPNLGSIFYVLTSTSLSGLFNGLANDDTFVADDFIWQIRYQVNAATNDFNSGSGQDVGLLVLQAVPEPSTLLLAACGAIGVGVVGLRRRRATAPSGGMTVKTRG